MERENSVRERWREERRVGKKMVRKEMEKRYFPKSEKTILFLGLSINTL